MIGCSSVTAQKINADIFQNILCTHNEQLEYVFFLLLVNSSDVTAKFITIVIYQLKSFFGKMLEDE
jgi:hypothetical protein